MRGEQISRLLCSGLYFCKLSCPSPEVFKYLQSIILELFNAMSLKATYLLLFRFVVLQYLVPQYERNLEEKERIMYIKVAGNFGLKEALPFLEKYAEDKMDQFPVHIRMISIWVLEKAALYNPEKVRQLKNMRPNSAALMTYFASTLASTRSETSCCPSTGTGPSLMRFGWPHSQSS